MHCKLKLSFNSLKYTNEGKNKAKEKITSMGSIILCTWNKKNEVLENQRNQQKYLIQFSLYSIFNLC